MNREVEDDDGGKDKEQNDAGSSKKAWTTLFPIILEKEIGVKLKPQFHRRTATMEKFVLKCAADNCIYTVSTAKANIKKDRDITFSFDRPSRICDCSKNLNIECRTNLKNQLISIFN